MALRCYLTIVELSRLLSRICYADPPLLGISDPGAKLVGKSERALSFIRTHVAKSTSLSTCHPRKPCHIASYPDGSDFVAAVAPRPCSRPCGRLSAVALRLGGGTRFGARHGDSHRGPVRR